MSRNIHHHTPPSFQILLMGPQHVGKSSIGSALAKKLHCPFFDTDRHILSQYTGMHKTVRELYLYLGEKKFRTLEKNALTQIPLHCVCATGGGLSENVQAHAHITPIHPKVLLVSTPEKIWPRIIVRGIPAYLCSYFSVEPSRIDLDLAKEKFIEIFHLRVQMYKKLTDYTIDVTDITVETAVDRILSYLRSCDYVQ